jgi:hypothetical protein
MVETVTLVNAAQPPDRLAPMPAGSWRLEIARARDTLSVPVLANLPLAPDPAIVRLVIVIQGDRRRPAEYLDAMAAAGLAAGNADTLILAPHFRVAEELEPDERRNGAGYWSSSGWKEGALSQREPWDRPWRISSFAVVDALLRAVDESGCWRRVRDVVVAGHSAGGQFVQRYAAGSRVAGGTGSLPACRFVVANPSSYLYLSEDRPAGRTDGFDPLTHADLAACPGANRYKYGLGRRNGYLAASPRDVIRERYRDRSIDYVVGELDNDPGDARFDTSCAAQLQGRTRNDRGRTFHRYLGQLFGPQVHARHRLIVVPGVGHDVRAIFGSRQVRAAVFGTARATALVR